MAIEGNLQSVDIQDIVQLLNINRSTGLLHIENATIHGVLYYRDGDVVNAEVEGMTGSAGAYVLLGQSEGRFYFEIAEHAKPQVITRSIHDLVLEAARRKDTLKRIRATIRHDNIVYLPLVDVRIPHLAKNFSEAEIRLLSRLDGQRDVKSIIAERKESAFEVFYHIYELEKGGHIKRVDIFKLLEVAEYKKLFGKKTDVHISPTIREEWLNQSMTYAECDVLEIRTQNMLFGQVSFVAKANVPEGTIMIPRPIMNQFEIEPGAKVLVRPILYPD